MKQTAKIVDAKGIRYTIEIEVSSEGVGSGEKLNWETLLPVKDNRRLSLSGIYGSGCGQCYDSIQPRTPGQEQLIKLWKEYHLNDCCAGTKRQTEYLQEKGKEQILAIKNILVEAGYEQYISDMIKDNLTTMPDYKVYCKLKKMTDAVGITVTRTNGKKDYFRKGDEKNIKDRWIAGLKNQWLKDNYRHLTLFHKMKIADVRKFAIKYDDYTGKFKDTNDYDLKKIVLQAAGLYIDRGYIYGQGWLMKELPETIEKDIDNLCLLLLDEEVDRIMQLADDEDEAEDFKMTTDDEKYDDDQHISIICSEMKIDHDEAIRFVALAKVLGESFLSLKENWEEEDNDEQRYSFGGTEYYIGTSRELTDVAKDIIDNDPEYEYFWRQAVEARRTTDGLDDWKKSIVDIDGFAHTLDRWDGQGTRVHVLGQEITVCKAG